MSDLACPRCRSTDVEMRRVTLADGAMVIAECQTCTHVSEPGPFREAGAERKTRLPLPAERFARVYVAHVARQDKAVAA